ncbi:protein kinase [Sorangium sp. So ce834]|uniref:serine/threonine protein kinase n=1 Tax=Sorangium sp. So ce834 TaxID=3133321 RepID=UPI003F6394E4
MSSGLNEGAIFAGRYQVVRRIASGAMGAVYEVIHIETTRRRALKVMLPHIVDDLHLRERFKLEARAAAHIESDFIVDVFDAGFDDATGMPFLVMELLRGEDLGRRLKRVGRFQPAEVLTYLHQIALALEKTHRASIIHRDLKPGNLFLTELDDGTRRVKVFDFGIAKLLEEGTTNVNATASVGTPVYMAPEQFRRGKVSAATDIYALGQIAYTLLVGESYWASELRENSPLMFMLIASSGPQQPASARAVEKGVELPPGFDEWFARMTAAAPADRFPTAISAVSAFAQLLGMPAVRSTSMPSLSEFHPARATLERSPGIAPTGTGPAVTRELPLRHLKARSLLVPLVLGGALVLGGLLYVATGRRTSQEKADVTAPAAEANGAVPPAMPQPDAPSTSQSPTTGPSASQGPTMDAPPAHEAPTSSSAATTTVVAPPNARKPQNPGGTKGKAPAPASSPNFTLRGTL